MAQGTCWDGYEQKGFKKKGNRSVPNCVAVQNAYTGRAVKQPTETENEFKIRHEMHSPFMDLKKKKKKIVKASEGKDIKTKDTPVDDAFKEKTKKSVYTMRRFVPNIDSDMRIYRRISSFKEPQEIKSGGLIKGKPKLAQRGWK